MNATQEPVTQPETQVETTAQQPRQPKARRQNPLSARHFEQVVKRPRRIREKMQAVVGLTWNLQGRLVVPLGAASACVQYTDGDHETMLCITGSMEPDTGEIRYQTVRMSHNWARNPVYGGYGPVLDPREPGDPTVGSGDKPNASWVRLGLALDSYRMAHSRDTTQLAAIPSMPKFLVGMPEMPDLAVPEAFNVLQYEAAIDAFLAESINPGDPLNPSTGYLVPRDFLTPEQYIGRPVYEDFRGLVGMAYPNPLSEGTQIRVSNPVWPVARRKKIFLKDLLAALDAGIDDPAIDTDVEILLSGMREMLGVTADMFLEDDLCNAIRNPGAELVSTKGIAEMSIEERMEKIVKALRLDYYILDGCYEEDIKEAAENPHQDLLASGTCRLLAMYRDGKLPIEESLTFTSTALGIPGVSARFYRERKATEEKYPGAAKVLPPDGMTPEGWLRQFDSRPRILPRWPASGRMTLVVVVPEGDSETAAYAILRKDALKHFIKLGDDVFPALFFTAPKSTLISKAEADYPLTLEMWTD